MMVTTYEFKFGELLSDATVELSSRAASLRPGGQSHSSGRGGPRQRSTAAASSAEAATKSRF